MNIFNKGKIVFGMIRRKKNKSLQKNKNRVMQKNASLHYLLETRGVRKKREYPVQAGVWLESERA